MDSKNKKYKILLTGGGTGGSVAPLLAVAEELVSLEKQETKSPAGDLVSEVFKFLWLGTKFGPEREMVEQARIKFKTISGGKWRRYFSLKNLADIFKIKLGFFQALFIMLKWRPSLVMSAGSFISVPVIWAAWLLRVPILIHQQDVRPGLANKLMAPLAKVVTVAFEKSLADYGKKAVWTGNPVRGEIRNLKLGKQKKHDFNESLPVVLILGGGTGAMTINKLAADSLNELTKFCRIIHITGKEKGIRNQESGIRNYVVYEFLNIEQMAEALKAADLVVTRAGMGFLSELSYLGKPAIIIPLPDSHQEANAAFFRNKEAAMVIDQKDLTAASLTQLIKNLLSDEKLRGQLAININNAMKKGANKEMVKIILEMINKN